MFNKELLRKRLAFIREGSEVERFHTKRMIQRNDVGHHSFHVAWLAWLMAGPFSKPEELLSLIEAALAHDLAEHVTGDMPGDFKREAGLREVFGEYERVRFAEVGMDFEPDLLPPEKRVLKLADMMEGAFFCISEASLGNGRVGIVFRNFRAYIRKFAPFNEAEEAIVEFIDELWAHYGVDDAPGWSKTAHKEESMQDEKIVGEDVEWPVERSPGHGLTDVLRREEAEGRATPAPTRAWDTTGAAEATGFTIEDGPSKAAVLGDAPVPEQPLDEPVDDRAGRDLPDTVQDESLPANARQYGGDHYKGTGYEHWDLVIDTGMNYFQGCATKYVTRARKHEAGMELNLLKAIHYVDKAQEAERQGRLKPSNSTYNVSDIREFVAANGLNELEYTVIADIVAWRWDNARENLVLLRGGATEPVQPSKGRASYSDN